MSWIQENSKYLQLLALVAFMALTRTSHFGTALSLPDATLAIFYLLGMMAGGLVSFTVLLAEAALIDYLAITHWNVSAYCISPAYVFLIPTYAVMFFAGRWSAQFKSLTLSDLTQVMSYLVLATSAAFLISNGSFYWLSGKFPNLAMLEYAERVAQYYPAYLGTTLMYGAIVIAASRFVAVLYKERYHIA